MREGNAKGKGERGRKEKEKETQRIEKKKPGKVLPVPKEKQQEGDKLLPFS